MSLEAKQNSMTSNQEKIEITNRMDPLQYTAIENTSEALKGSSSTSTSHNTRPTVLTTDNNRISVHLTIPFKELCIGALLLPLCSMVTCFITAYIFQQEHIHETHCRVYNIIPSISAITGISPQRYLWRISIAIHVGPRFLIAFAYRNYYRELLHKLSIPPIQMAKAERLISICFWLSIIEISALIGVTYISNRENYPMHEKIFITFMAASLVYMFLTIQLWNTLYPNGPPTPAAILSLKLKKCFLISSILSAVLLMIFFAKHRFYCHDLAFSWFATAEYLVALLNMASHITSIFEFSNNHLMITSFSTQFEQQLNGDAENPTHSNVNESGSKKLQ